jgi:hypothetical protein
MISLEEIWIDIDIAYPEDVMEIDEKSSKKFDFVNYQVIVKYKDGEHDIAWRRRRRNSEPSAQTSKEDWHWIIINDERIDCPVSWRQIEMNHLLSSGEELKRDIYNNLYLNK